MEFEYFVKEAQWEQYFEYWHQKMYEWLTEIGVNSGHVHDHEVPRKALAHYSRRTIDIEYDYSFGRKELYGLAYRTDFDLRNHMEKSGKDMHYVDPDTKEKFIPHVVEPTFGLDRSVLVVLLESYCEEEREGEKRVFLKLPPKLAPYKVAVFPLLQNKQTLIDKAKSIHHDLRKDFEVDWDARGNIGKRYFAQDEIGTPYCVTIDFQTLKDNTVTVRDRDTTRQERVEISALAEVISKGLS
jgi:glycyl-tRNA synthetase